MNDSYESPFIHHDSVESARTHLLKENELHLICAFYKLLADPTRMKICLALSHEKLCVCDLSSLLEMTESAISHQLRLLKQARILKSEKKGKMVYYELADFHIYDIISQTKEHLDE